MSEANNTIKKEKKQYHHLKKEDRCEKFSKMLHSKK